MPSGVFLQFYPGDVDIYGGIQEALVAAAIRFRNAAGIFYITERDISALTRLTEKTVRIAMRRMSTYLKDAGRRHGHTRALYLEGTRVPAKLPDGIRIGSESVPVDLPEVPVDLPEVVREVPVDLPDAYKEERSASERRNKHSAAPECAVFDLPSGPAPPRTRQSQTAEGKTDESRYLSDQERADVAHYPPEQRSAIASQLQHIQTTSGFVAVTADLVDKFLSAAGPRCKPYDVADWLAGKAESQRKGGCLIPNGPGYFIRAVRGHFGGGVPRKPPASQFQALEIAQKASVNGPGVLPTRPPGSGAANEPRATDSEREMVPEGWATGMNELLGKVKSFPSRITRP